jgi:GT2 family glycosyltransferase
MVKIATIILNYNNIKDTLECLKSLEKISTKGFKHRIFLLDYGKQDQSRQLKFQFHHVTIVRKNKNLGFTKANNIGIKKALKWGADYILILNNDTLVSKDFLLNLFYFLETNKEIAAVSPKIYFAKGFEFHKDRYKNSNLGNVIWFAGGQIDWDNIYGSHIGVDQVDKGQFEQVTDSDFFSGCCTLIRVKVLQKVGLFNEKYFLYWEDSDLSQRILKKGWEIKYYPKAHVWHKNAGGSAVGSDLHNYFLSRNRLYFAKKYASLKTKLALHRQSFKQLITADKWTKKGILDYYFVRMGKGSWHN